MECVCVCVRREKVDELGVMCRLMDTIARSGNNNSDTAEREQDNKHGLPCERRTNTKLANGATTRPTFHPTRPSTYLRCDLEVLVLLQQLLRVVNARAGGGVCGQVKLSGVVDPLQGLERRSEVSTQPTAHFDKKSTRGHVTQVNKPETCELC